MRSAHLGIALAVGLLAGCTEAFVPVYDPEPIPFPEHLYDRYSAGVDSGYGVLDESGHPPPRISPEAAAQTAAADPAAREVIGNPETLGEVIGLMRRGLLDPDGRVTSTAWLVAFEAGPVVSVNDQTGEVAEVSCCPQELHFPP